jgi:hypothetical protein
MQDLELDLEQAYVPYRDQRGDESFVAIDRDAAEPRSRLGARATRPRPPARPDA